MSFPSDYEERVYAGVLGKIIGVCLGRPVEGWTFERIREEIGEVEGYVHERLGKPLVVVDDDLSGAFTFPRALEDSGCRADLSPADVAEAWLNYLVEGRTTLWWGGIGQSTEHTAYLRLKAGIAAPESGSAGRNGRTVAEQVGGQIFIDGWGFAAPGNPDLAARLARTAASVSHDGEALHAAAVIAAMEAAAFTEEKIDALLEIGLARIPGDALIARVIRDVRGWEKERGDWRRTRERIAGRYGYDRFGGGAHVVPNHAIVILALVHSRGRFHDAVRIAAAAGWDTDCNAGTVGCLMGIRGGLAGLEGGADWRGPLADRVFVTSADGAGAVTDAVRIADRLAGLGRRLAGREIAPPKGGARFHFGFPGSVQGFAVSGGKAAIRLENRGLPGGQTPGERALAVSFAGLSPDDDPWITTPTFIPPGSFRMPLYGFQASPAIYSGQTLSAEVRLDLESDGPAFVALGVKIHAASDESLAPLSGPVLRLAPGDRGVLQWTVPETGGGPIGEAGLRISAGSAGRVSGTLHLLTLDWKGPPSAVLGPPSFAASRPYPFPPILDPDLLAPWARAWVNAADRADFGGLPRPFRIIQNEGRGFLIQGAREWRGYKARVEVTPRLAAAAGLAFHVQGRRRHYALLLRRPGRVELVKALRGETLVAAAPLDWDFDRSYALELCARGKEVEARVDGGPPLCAPADPALSSGAVALVVEEGNASFGPVEVAPS